MPRKPPEAVRRRRYWAARIRAAADADRRLALAVDYFRAVAARDRQRSAPAVEHMTGYLVTAARELEERTR